MKILLLLICVNTLAFSYGYWDIFQYGGRTVGLDPASAAMAGAAIPVDATSLAIFSNPSGLAGMTHKSISFGGWGTGWREEIYYHYTCPQPYRFSKGGMSPRGSFAFTTPLGNGFTAGAGIATVAQFEMNGYANVYKETGFQVREIWKHLTATGSGDLHEALVSLSGNAGSVRVGLAAGARFGSGESTVYSNRVTGGTQFDSTYNYSWDESAFAVRAGASTTIGFTSLYSSYVSGSDHYQSYAGIGAAAAFPFLKGGFLGAEIGLFQGKEMKIAAYSRLPWIFPGANSYIGVSGFRPEGTLKTGMGISFGGDYTFGSNRVSAVYQWNSRFRDGPAVPVDYINWVYDSGESFIIGYERSF